MLSSAKLYKIAYNIHYKKIIISNDKTQINQIAYYLYKYVSEKFNGTAEEKYSLSQIENLSNSGIGDDSISDDVKLICNKIIETNGEFLQELIKKNNIQETNSSNNTSTIKNYIAEKGSNLQIDRTYHF